MNDEITQPKAKLSIKDIKPPTYWKPANNDNTKVPSESTILTTDINPIITVVKDPQFTLGKEFTLNPDGSISKRPKVSVSVGIAIMREVHTHQELAALLREVGEDPHAAIINASFTGIEIGEEFYHLIRARDRNSDRSCQNRSREPEGHSQSYF